MQHRILIEFDDTTGEVGLDVKADGVKMAAAIASLLQSAPHLTSSVIAVQAVVTAALMLHDEPATKWPALPASKKQATA